VLFVDTEERRHQHTNQRPKAKPTNRANNSGNGAEAARHMQTEDIVAAYRSDAFRQAITGNPAYDGFRLPDYFPH
jgi:hypothetical protein